MLRSVSVLPLETASGLAFPEQQFYSSGTTGSLAGIPGASVQGVRCDRAAQLWVGRGEGWSRLIEVWYRTPVSDTPLAVE